MLTREQMAARAAREIPKGAYVNLGIGLPTLVANYLRPEDGVTLQSENGLLGMGAFPKREEADADLINAGKQTISLLPGASLFNSADSFAMIRGGHMDLTILGAMEVAENGDIANWKVPGKLIKGMGGAMDLVASGTPVIVLMQHRDKAGNSKLLPACTLPLTGTNCVSRIITELAVLDILPEGGFLLREIAPGCRVDEIRDATAGTLYIDQHLTEITSQSLSYGNS